MSEGSTPEERTEMPTPKRMGQLRKEGQIHMSNDLVVVATMATGFWVLTLMSHRLWVHLQEIFSRMFREIGKEHILNYESLQKHAFAIMATIAPDILIIVFAIAVVATLAVMLQTDWNVKDKKFKFELGKMNPINGLMSLVSISGLTNLLKSIVKLAVILPSAYFSLEHFAPDMVGLMHLSLEQVFAFTSTAMRSIFWKVLYMLLAMAIFDYFWGKHQWLKINKMTKQEVKEERKSVEGDEETKRKIQAMGLQRIMQRIRDSVPKADVVITNPTHFAVALKYDRLTMRAPIVVAKGADHLAKRIREIAREHNVPVLERKVLARALYSSTEVGSEIPYELFRAVAEVLAYVYKLKNPYAASAASASASPSRGR